jgi:hypothetical protein
MLSDYKGQRSSFLLYWTSGDANWGGANWLELSTGSAFSSVNQLKYIQNDRRWWLFNQNTIWMTGDDD